MTEQRTPDELICEKLLGWKRCPSAGQQQWYCNHDRRDATSGPFLTCVTPSFATWADAGLILDALAKARQFPDIGCAQNNKWHCLIEATDFDPEICEFETGPEAIRAAALAYVRRQS